MVNLWQSWIKKIENSPITFWQAVLLIYIAVFFREFLENYANFFNFSHIAGVIDTFFHLPFWFSAVFLLVFIILNFLTGEKIEKISRLGAIFSFAIITPPILDLIINKGDSIFYVFLTGSFSDLFNLYFSFFQKISNGSYGATIGLKIEIIVGMASLGYYIFQKKKNILYSTIGVILFYSTIFIFASLPVFIFGAHNLFTDSKQPVNYENVDNFYSKIEPANSITNYRTFIFDKNNYQSEDYQNISSQQTITFSIILLIINILLLGWWYCIYNRKKFLAMIKNFRFFSRVIYYFFLICLGISIGTIFAGHNPIGSLFDFVSFLAMFLSFLFAVFFCIWENDEADIEIDKISNPGRPLIKGEFSISEWQTTKYLFLFLSLNFSFLLGLYQFIFILLFLAIYHIYSAPPLRLKRFPAISSFLVAVGALIPVLMGFFLSSGTENLRKFPPKYLFGILAIFFLAENVKNLKDVEGDKKNNIKTIPVILGEEKGKLAIGVLFFISVILIPVIFYMNVFTFLTAVIFGTILFFLINKKDFREKYIFTAYFIFIVFFLFEILFLL
jgi:4-hydroxybenzoate polyprenyltransferase